jgi:hypothetical protein
LKILPGDVLRSICFLANYTWAINVFLLSENKKIAADKHPDDPFLNWEDIQNMKLSWRVIQESMRLTPPVEMSFRVAPQDMEFGGFRIPKSWKVRATQLMRKKSWNQHNKTVVLFTFFPFF